MTDQLTVAGLEIDDLITRLARVKASLRALISSTLDLTSDDPLGQTIIEITEAIQNIAELLQATYSAFDPTGASGHSLTALAAITGTEKRAATYGTVTLTVNLNGGTTLLAGNKAQAGTDPDNIWSTNVDVVAPAGPAADYPVFATCDTAGEMVAPTGTITTIVTPVAGWNTVDNAADATSGQEEETQGELRERRETELTATGSTNVDAINAGLSSIEEILQHIVYENDGWHMVAVPPKCVEAVIWDGVAPAPGTDAEVAAVLFEETAGGIQSYGTTVVVHEDEQGNSHNVGFTRATQIAMELDYTIVVGDGYPGDAVLIAALAQWDDDNITIGGANGWFVYSRWYSLPFELVDGVVGITSFRMRISGGSWTTTDIVIGNKEIPTVDSGDITVVS